MAGRFARRHCRLRQMHGSELRLLQRTGVLGTKEHINILAKVAQAQAAIALQLAGDKFGDDGIKGRIVVVQAFEGNQRADQHYGLAQLHTRREQEQQ